MDIEELWEDLTVRATALRGNHSQVSVATDILLFTSILTLPAVRLWPVLPVARQEAG